VRVAADVAIGAVGRTAAAVTLLTAIATGAIAIVLGGAPKRRIAWFAAAIAVATITAKFLSTIVHRLLPGASAPLEGAAAIVVTSVIVVVAAVVAIPRFNLQRPHASIGGSWPGSRPRFGIVAVGVAAVLAASLAGSITEFAGVTDALGAPTATSLLGRDGVAGGYRWQSLGTTDGTPDHPPLERYTLAPVAGAGVRAVLVDVIPEQESGNGAEADLRSALPLVKRQLLESEDVDLGHGVTAQRMTFGGRGEPWTTVTWMVPVRGSATAPYQRVVVAMARPRTLTDQTVAGSPTPGERSSPADLVPEARAVVRTEFGSEPS
jgi:hypothetical protein